MFILYAIFMRIAYNINIMKIIVLYTGISVTTIILLKIHFKY